MRIRFDACSFVRFWVNDWLLRCAFLGALRVRCYGTDSWFRKTADLRKMAITENLEQINALPLLASIVNWAIYILSNFGCLEASSSAAIFVFSLMCAFLDHFSQTIGSLAVEAANTRQEWEAFWQPWLVLIWHPHTNHWKYAPLSCLLTLLLQSDGLTEWVYLSPRHCDNWKCTRCF